MFKLGRNSSSPAYECNGFDTRKCYGNFTTSAYIPTVQYTRLQSLFENALSICAMLPNVIFQFLNTVLQQRLVYDHCSDNIGRNELNLFLVNFANYFQFIIILSSMSSYYVHALNVTVD